MNNPTAEAIAQALDESKYWVFSSAKIWKKIIDRAREIDAGRAEQAGGDAPCGCGLSTCVEPWEPGCGLGTSMEHAVPDDWREDVQLAAQMLTWGQEEGLTASQEREVTAHQRRLFDRLAAPPAVGEGDAWRCFHCDEVFTTQESAAVHFGNSERDNPACQVDIVDYRRMVAMDARYAEEDADVHRSMRRMASEHQTALQRAEETGYARGLKDSGLCPCAANTAPPIREVGDEYVTVRRSAILKAAESLVLEECEGDAADLLVELEVIDNAGNPPNCLSTAPRQVVGEARLFDSQWVNIVNHNNCWRDYEAEDAVNEAVKMAESAIASNVANGKLPQGKQPAPGAVDEAMLLRAVRGFNTGLHVDYDTHTQGEILELRLRNALIAALTPDAIRPGG